MSAPTLLSLSDDLLRCILLRCLAFSVRAALGRTCRRFCSLVRAGTTLWAHVVCGAYPHERIGVGVGRPAALGGDALVPLRIDASVTSLPGFGAELRRGIELLHLAFRRTAAWIGVRSFRLQRH